MRKEIRPLDLISFSHLSLHFTQRKDIIRKGRINSKYKDQVRELEKLIKFWMSENKD